jgi:aminomethyltransferase
VLKVVLDTHQFVSSWLVKKGPSAALLDLWRRDRAFTLVTSRGILLELDRVLHYPRIRKKYSLAEEEIRGLMDALAREAVVTEDKEKDSKSPGDRWGDVLYCGFPGHPMTTTSTFPLRRTPFHDFHADAGGRMVDFAGWSMPVQFAGILAEHRAVREKAGLFDISHMGQFWATGPGALAGLQALVTIDVAVLSDGEARYALLCRDDGGVVDDLYIYRLAGDQFLVIVNASRAERDWAHVTGRAAPGLVWRREPDPAALALQGPRAAGIMGKMIPAALRLKRNECVAEILNGTPVTVARTGYTGEDGFELFGPARGLASFYPELLKAPGVVAAGLGCRDTLRLEMGYRLYGNDLDEDHSALEAGLGWAVKWDKGDFTGRDALLRQKNAGLTRRFIGFRLREKGIPRHGHEILSPGKTEGRVTSGTFSPSLHVGLGMGYVDAAALNRTLAVRVHDRLIPLEISPLPFYRRQT